MNTRAIIRQIAKKHGVTTTEVKREMRLAIQEAMKSTDPVAHEHWNVLSPNEKEPTIEQFLTYMARQVGNQPI